MDAVRSAHRFRLLPVVLLVLTGLLAPLASAAAQRAARLEVALAAEPAREPPQIRALNVLESARLRDLLRSGFPAELRYRVELWATAGLVNDLEGSQEWTVVVHHDRLTQTYQVARIVEDRVTLLGRFSDLEGAQGAVERPFRPVIRIPRRGRRYYYHARVEVETLSLSDLDEVQRWLRGELRPAVRGERNPGTALSRGVGRLMVRLIGGERRELEARSPTFAVP